MNATLQAVKALFDTLNEQGIPYCHWKSNQHLDQALRGLTDLDILVERSQRQLFKTILYQLRCKSIISPPGRQYPAIEDYLGYDDQTGKFFHLHVHYQLILGERFVKNYHLPLEQQFLESATINHGVKVVTPELEVIVLAIRALLKYRDRDAIKDALSIRSRGLPSNILREFEYLFQQTTLERISAVLKSEVNFVSPGVVLEFLEIVSQSHRSGYQICRLRNALRRELQPFQRYSRRQAIRKYFYALWSPRIPFGRSFLAKKRLDSGGVLIAVIGADGAGKSTIVKILRKWLSWKLDARVFYMGSGEHLSRLSQAIKFVSEILAWLGRRCSAVLGEENGLSRILGRGYRFTRHLRYLSIAQTRYERYLASRQQAAQGSIIIYDRYPLAGIHRAMDDSRPPMDGPRIAWTCKGENLRGITAHLARTEEEIYRKISPPDYLVLLHVSPAVSLQRKPEHRREEVGPKIQAIESMDRCGLHIIDVDAEEPLEQTLLQIKGELWNLL
jgi:thymidylate kinase